MDEMEKDELKKDELKTSEAPENASHEKHSDDDHDSAAAQHPDYCQELATIVRGTITPKALKEKVENYHENDIADVLSILNRAEREKLYHVLDAQTLSTVLEYAEDVEVYLNELGLRQRIQVLSHMETDKVVEYLKTLDKTERNNLMDLFDEDTRHDVNLLWSFDEDEIGSVMTTNYIEVTEGISVREAMKELIDQAAENDNISTIYVIDKDRTFYGAIDLKELIIARENTPLNSLVITSYPYVYAQERIEDCVNAIRDYSEDSIPVLDNQNKLLGVITAQDFLQVVDDEMGDDYAKLAGLTSEEDLKEPIGESLRKRLPWLLILLGLGLVVSSVVGVFEAVVAQLTLVVCFQSLILDMAGNVGTQSLAVTIRVLMDENLSGKEKLALVWKEARIGLLNGVILGSASFIAIGLYIHFFKAESWGFAFGVSGCLGAAMILAMFLSSITGTTIPMLFKKIHIDPAVASGPLITTLNDLVAVISYSGLTWIFLIEMFHLQG